MAPQSSHPGSHPTRIARIYRRSGLFALTYSVFTVASLACGAAATPFELVLARLLQGAGAALMTPNVLSLIGVLYSGEDRVRALTVYGTVMGLAAVGGQLIGGVLMAVNP